MANNAQNEDIDRFDRWSTTYEDSRMHRFFMNRVHKLTIFLAKKLAPNPKDILDVGCGTGRLLRQMLLEWPQAHVTGVDPAKGMIEVAQKLTPAGIFHLGMGENLPITDVSMDIVVTTLSFHHWQDQVAGVRELARVLRPGGCLIITDLSFPLPCGVVRLLSHGRFHNRKEMRSLLNQAGLQSLTQKSIPWLAILATAGMKKAG